MAREYEIRRRARRQEETRQRIETLLAALGHALDFWIWHSLAREWDPTDEGAIELMVGLARSSRHG
jgi:hypothetical protein